MRSELGELRRNIQERTLLFQWKGRPDLVTMRAPMPRRRCRFQQGRTRFKEKRLKRKRVRLVQVAREEDPNEAARKALSMKVSKNTNAASPMRTMTIRGGAILLVDSPGICFTTSPG